MEFRKYLAKSSCAKLPPGVLSPHSKSSCGELIMHSKPNIKTKFWINVGDELLMWLMQVDLQNHSVWASDLTWPDVREARRDFKRRLNDNLKRFGFICSHWAGDGGLFVAPVSKVGAHRAVPAKDVLAAAYKTEKIFSDWEAKETDRSKLSLRVSLHKTSIAIDDDPGNWFSVELNCFMKYERDLAMAGAISMTEPVYKSLPGALKRPWFPTSVQVGDTLTWKVYWNRKQKEDLERTTFVRWLSNSKYASPGRLAAQLPHSREGILACGDCIVLVAPVSSVGFENKIELQQMAEVRWDKNVPLPSRSAIGHDFIKLCPIVVLRPLTDSPKMVIQYVPVWYKWVREFGRKISNDESGKLRLQYATRALSLDRSEDAIPDLLCSHIVVIVDDVKTKDSWLLVCQRAEKEGQLDFEIGSWSVSIEEQYRPALNVVDGHKEFYDSSVHESVVRGIREELGVSEKIALKVETHCLFVEATELRSAILAVARLSLPIDNFKKGAQSALDRGEIQSAALLPLTPSNIDTLLDSEIVPEQFLNSRARWIRGKIDSKSRKHWHTSSKLRLALASWLLDST
jgi:hypothetical protein